MNKALFIDLINTNISGTTTGSFVVNTEVKLAKGNPFGEVRQTQTLNGMIGFDYNNSVNNLAEKEGKTERDAKPRTWGTLTENRVWVKHTPKGTTEERTYLQMKVQKQLQSNGEAPTFWSSTMGEVTAEDIAPWKASKSKSSTQSDLEGEVITRDINLDNIIEARVFGKKVVVDKG